MRPITQMPITIINDCECKVDTELLKKAILWIADGDNVFQKKHIFMHGQYPCVSIFNRKMHIHRLMWLYDNKKILDRSIHIHHKDGDKMNAEMSNLEPIHASEHMSHHNKGKKLSDEHRRKIGLANSKRKGMKMKKTVDIDLKVLSKMLNSGISISKCAKHFNCGWDTIKARITENTELLK